MADWKDTYLASLQARDEVEKAHKDIYDAYTKLADRAAQLSRPHSIQPTPTESRASPPPQSIVGRFSTKSPAPAPSPDSPTLTTFRTDLQTAQSSRLDLQTRLTAALSELESLRAKSKSDSKRIAQLTSSATQLGVRLRDRDEELRGKAKLLEDVQDENVTLNLQLNVADEQALKLKRENQDLVDRWMEKKSKEAERMNEEGKFG